jgi:hypothetical protein
MIFNVRKSMREPLPEQPQMGVAKAAEPLKLHS